LSSNQGASKNLELSNLVWVGWCLCKAWTLDTRLDCRLECGLDWTDQDNCVQTVNLWLVVSISLSSSLVPRPFDLRGRVWANDLPFEPARPLYVHKQRRVWN